MNRNFKLTIILAVFLSGCSTTQKIDSNEAIHNACYSYIYGKNGFDINYDKAFLWCSKGAMLGMRSSQTLLAELYLEGNGTSKNLKEATSWYKLAAEQDHSHAQLMYFLITNNGASKSSEQEKADGVNYLKKSMAKNYSKAIEYYEKIYGNRLNEIQIDKTNSIFDFNRNGLIEIAEFNAYIKFRKDGKLPIEAVDTDHDGQMSAAEAHDATKFLEAMPGFNGNTVSAYLEALPGIIVKKID